MSLRLAIFNEQLHELLSLFSYEHLPEHLQAVSKPFYDLAMEQLHMEFSITNGGHYGRYLKRDVEGFYSFEHNWEHLHFLRCLLDAKDAAVRAHVIADLKSKACLERDETRSSER